VAAALLALATVVAAFAAARSPGRLGFTVLLGSVVLVPASLALPNGVTPLLTVHRVVLVGLLLGLVLHRGPSGRWRPTPTTLAFLLYLLVVVVAGVILATPGLDSGDVFEKFLNVVEQLLVLVVCLAIVRADRDPAWFVRPLAGVLVLSAGIALVEHITGSSWSQWVFSAVPSQQGSDAAARLAVRDGVLRVRAGNEYPLGYAWVAAALLPAFIVAALRFRRWLVVVLAAGGAVVAGTIYWSFARSALVGALVALVLLALAARHTKVTAVVVAGLAVGVAVFVAAPAVSEHFSTAVDQGSIDVREQRIPIVLGAVADHPWTGLGLTGLRTIGLPGTDATYLLTYGELGAGGLAALVGLLAIAVIGVARGVVTTGARLRAPAAAVLSGVVTLVVAGLAFDSMALVGTADVLWLLVGVGLAMGERTRGTVSLRAVPDLYAPIAAAAALAGVAVVLTAPTHYAQEVRFSTLPTTSQAASYNPVVTGNQLVDTVCDAVRAESRFLPEVDTSCRNLFTAPGVGAIRVESASSQRTIQALADLRLTAIRAGVTDVRFQPDTDVVEGRPTPATTAPLWLSLVVLMVLFGTSGQWLAYIRRRRLQQAPRPPRPT
jgi:hypothetical protein